ncbi:MAG: BON domain-containing protein [Gemmataceae bacterium]
MVVTFRSFCSALFLPLIPATVALGQPPVVEQTRRAPDLTIECRRLFLEDPVLAPLNLGVRVKGRVAILWGPAPSKDVARRAEQCLRTLVELADVKNEFIILPELDWSPTPGATNRPAAPPESSPLPEAPVPILPEPVRPPRVGRDGSEIAQVRCAEPAQLRPPLTLSAQ